MFQLLKSIFSVIFFLILSVQLQAQEKKKVYFLVDTVNIMPENRLVEIIGKAEIAYIFYCQCLEKKNIVFTYLNSHDKEISDTTLNVDYLSWKSFLQLVDNDILRFSQKYDLYITEVLPSKKYQTVKGYYAWQSESAQ